jgi:lantibiotic modifying enzyme
MNVPQDIQDTARAGADSVFGYVERTAETVPDGVRWKTLSYQNEFYYDPKVFDGVAGISLFLSDYHHLTGNARARDLALGANRWCSAPERTHEDESLYVGRTGVGMAWLRYALATGDPEALQRASEFGDRLLAPEPGPVTDFLMGAAGNGLFLLRLHEASHQDRHLAGSVRHAEWLEAVKVQNESGCHWSMRVGAPRSGAYLGFAHGIAGIGYFLALLYEATQDARWADLTRAIAETLSRQARPDRGGLNWPPLMDQEMDRCQWCHGSPGVGLFYTRAFEILGDPAFLKTAEAAGETTFQYGDMRGNPGQCHGLSGNAELFIELYRITKDPKWLERAHDFAKLALAYRKPGTEGDTWQADEPGYESPDFLCGAAGAGHFFLRLGAPDRVRMPLM